VSPAPALSVVMPVRDGRPHLEASLPALLRSGGERLLEVIVVDDGSQDGSGERASELGARVLRSGGRLGPAAARNVGAAEAPGDVVLFVDADVVVHPDALGRIADAFADPGTVAVFGSYDDRPPQRGFASQYMNLRHHHVHRTPAEDASTFWAGLGAVRREAFLAAGGFDAKRFPHPSVEDIELAPRLRAGGGRIRRVPGIQGTHLKRWSVGDVLRTDLLRRAIPWARLMQERPGAYTDLNVGRSERLRAALAGALAAGAVLAAAGLVSGWIPLALLGAAALANRPLLALFWRTNGAWFALRGLLFHQLYYLYGAGAWAWCLASRRGQARPESL